MFCFLFVLQLLKRLMIDVVLMARFFLCFCNDQLNDDVDMFLDQLNDDVDMFLATATPGRKLYGVKFLQ